MNAKQEILDKIKRIQLHLEQINALLTAMENSAPEGTRPEKPTALFGKFVPICSKCGSNRQVWVNQVTGHWTCHRVSCEPHTPISIDPTTVQQQRPDHGSLNDLGSDYKGPMRRSSDPQPIDYSIKSCDHQWRYNAMKMCDVCLGCDKERIRGM